MDWRSDQISAVTFNSDPRQCWATELKSLLFPWWPVLWITKCYWSQRFILKHKHLQLLWRDSPATKHLTITCSSPSGHSGGVMEVSLWLYINWTSVLLPFCCDGSVAMVILSMFVCLYAALWLVEAVSVNNYFSRCVFVSESECVCVYFFRMDWREIKYL